MGSVLGVTRICGQGLASYGSLEVFGEVASELRGDQEAITDRWGGASQTEETACAKALQQEQGAQTVEATSGWGGL